ncbi:type II secretion system protein [Gemmiger sp.]
MFKKLKDKKGFTLVELIVVLVILAILAALLVPALTGYIDKAKEESIKSETRMVVMAAQTLIDEQYAKAPVNTVVTVKVDDSAATGYDSTNSEITLKKSDIENLSETKGTIGAITIDGTTKGKIASLEYTNKGKKCTYTYSAANGSNYTVANS